MRPPFFVGTNKTKRIAGFGGCNRFAGTYQQTGDRLTFGKIAMTFMACPEGMEIERDFAAALEQVKSWKILGEHLELLDGNGAFLARFERRRRSEPRTTDLRPWLWGVALRDVRNIHFRTYARGVLWHGVNTAREFSCQAPQPFYRIEK